MVSGMFGKNYSSGNFKLNSFLQDGIIGLAASQRARILSDQGVQHVNF